MIWLDSATDPSINAQNPGPLRLENLAAITQVADIPLNTFDIGHVFTGSCPDGDGMVGTANLVPFAPLIKHRAVPVFSLQIW